MPQEEAPRLSHVRLYVTDVPKMTDFYTKVLGFVVSVLRYSAYCKIAVKCRKL